MLLDFNLFKLKKGLEIDNKIKLNFIIIKENLIKDSLNTLNNNILFLENYF